MKKTFAIIMLIALLCAPVFVGAGYGIFIFAADAAANISASVSNSNAMFGEVNSDYYKIYFFASPYYATGAEIGENGATITDPLEIANHAKNPYNLDDPYCLYGGTGNTKFQNITVKNETNSQISSIGYASYKSILTEGTAGEGLKLELFQKKDYTGYIRPFSVDVAGTTITSEKTSTYVAVTVQGNLNVDLLDAIIAQSEYKDPWGFGPEFCGWTADKQATLERAVYNYDASTNKFTRYSKEDGKMFLCNENGVLTEHKPDLIGYYGSQGEIEQVTSNTSLSMLDQTDADGSKAGDRVIYLYPVFVAKNYNKAMWEYGTYSPLFKFRVNPIADGSYTDKQIGEIDYSLSPKRYTVCMFQRRLKVTEGADKKYNVNYYTGDLYIGKDDIIQLDCNDYYHEWATLLPNSYLRALTNNKIEGGAYITLPEGYYNVDLTYLYSSEEKQDLIDQYVNSEKYIYVYCGTYYDSGFYVVGFQKVDDFRMVSGENGNFQYDGSNYQQVYTAMDSDLERYYYVDDVYLAENEQFAFLNKGSSGIATTAMAVNAKHCKECICGCGSENAPEICTACLENANCDCQGVFSADGQIYQLPAASGSGLTVNDTTLTCTEEGYYSFRFKVTYDNGDPTSIQVAYQKKEDKYRIVILNGDPGGNLFIGKMLENKYSAVYMPTWTDGTIDLGKPFNVYKTDTIGIVAAYTGEVNSVVGKSAGFTVYQWNTEGTTVTTDVKEIYSLLTVDLSGKKLIDTATGLEITAELFENNSFQLNRNYVLYIQ